MALWDQSIPGNPREAEKKERDSGAGEAVKQEAEDVNEGEGVKKETKDVGAGEGVKKEAEDVAGEGVKKEAEDVAGEGVKKEAEDVGAGEGVKKEAEDVNAGEGVKKEAKDVGAGEGVKKEAEDVNEGEGVKKEAEDVNAGEGVKKEAEDVNVGEGVKQDGEFGQKSYGKIPEGFLYGTEYSPEEINTALAAQNPWEIVPSRDENGHGTFLTGIACGNEEREKQFQGIAPLADIAVVKCKEAKNTLKEYYRIYTEEPVFMESDIMLGIRYLTSIAKREGKPMVICLGMGTNLGSHYEGGALGSVMKNYGSSRGLIMVTGGGNEGNTAHHFRSEEIDGNAETEVEFRVGEKERGFTMQLWCMAPKLCSVALISPSGEFSGRTYAKLGERRKVNFLLDGTTVNIEYFLVSFESGDECIQLRFQSPAEGVWRLRVFNETDLPTVINVWLPMRNFLGEETYFLKPDPDITMCEPSNNKQLIATTYFQGKDRSVVAESSRGYNRLGEIRPDVSSPGINIYGPLPWIGNTYPLLEERRQSARYGYRSGSSEGTAVLAGACILLIEWGLVRRNDLNMNTVGVQKYLIRGADRSGRNFPDKVWGYGTLDLYGTFEWLLLRV